HSEGNCISSSSRTCWFKVVGVQGVRSGADVWRSDSVKVLGSTGGGQDDQSARWRRTAPASDGPMLRQRPGSCTLYPAMDLRDIPARGNGIGGERLRLTATASARPLEIL